MQSFIISTILGEKRNNLRKFDKKIKNKIKLIFILIFYLFY